MSNKHFHYLILSGVIILGAILRLGNLDLKPLWMDEIITSIFSLGKSYQDLPLDQILPLTKITDIFTYQPGISCSQIAENIAAQSTHPPLFFCGMYVWLGWLQSWGINWVFGVRSLPVLFGIVGIFVIYWLNRIAFSPKAGLAAAACMTVSPFAVYLSQEARHYTLPMLLISLALIGLIQIQKDIFQADKIQVWVWCYWVIINSIALYVHYFCILALIAQVGTLILFLVWQRRNIRLFPQVCLALLLSILLIAISFLPWLAILLNHSQSSDTDWLHAPQHIAPLYQTVINWVLMVISLPVEKQPIINAAFSAFLMIFAGIWIGRKFIQGVKRLLIAEKTKFSAFILCSFTVWVIFEFLAIIYLLQKDITVVPRYNFIYYPSFCALLAASLIVQDNRDKRVIRKKQKKYLSNFKLPLSQNLIIISKILKLNFLQFKLIKYPIFVVLFFGTISCLFLLFNLVFQKPFQPGLVAKNLNQEPSIPTTIVVGYSNYQDIALGLSFTLALQQLQAKNNAKYNVASQPTEFAFFSKKNNFEEVLKDITNNISIKRSPQQLQSASAQTQDLEIPRLNLWLIASGLRQRDFPAQIILASQNICKQDIQQYYRIGIPYQLYRCDGD
ncbi:glycosyltransferase family 39 protein [Calothrix sp. UHCC 0171]|uniref:glycosyltransferase family 39 protein n=1 Tax=Calothrix sp. UHCC 0171 TaxID=3110245 RepID=UPI002B20912D|nr:glycosyltransferase family 39 protein [Calothrix sp. UHCC 0171]MEA5573777.1 glycosyltransferase family 39 protein [Calothrix sp. UHCC 0171]